MIILESSKIIQKTCNIQETYVLHDHLQINLCACTSKCVFHTSLIYIHDTPVIEHTRNISTTSTTKFVEKPLQHPTFDPWHQCPAESCPTWWHPWERNPPEEWYHTRYIRNRSWDILKTTFVFFKECLFDS